MKRRIEKLEDQQPELDQKKVLIQLGEQWQKSAWKGDTATALQARKDAGPLLDAVDKPYCKKMLYIHWRWFVNYLNEDVRDCLNELVYEGKMPNAFADPDEL